MSWSLEREKFQVRQGKLKVAGMRIYLFGVQVILTTSKAD